MQFADQCLDGGETRNETSMQATSSFHHHYPTLSNIFISYFIRYPVSPLICCGNRLQLNVNANLESEPKNDKHKHNGPQQTINSNNETETDWAGLGWTSEGMINVTD